MEGLIPLVFKSLKRSKTTRKYKCLSSGASVSYNIADFYVNDDEIDHLSKKNFFTPEHNNKVSDLGGSYHRRNHSVHVDHHLRSSEFVEAAAKDRQLVRFRSHRLFSCVTGT